MTRRTPDGAVKWALRDFLREEWRAFEDRVSILPMSRCRESMRRTCVDFRHGGGDLRLSLAMDEILALRGSGKCVCQDM